LFRKIAWALILVPLAVLIIAFAVANRHDVTVSLDPFSTDHPALALTQPLFVVIFVVLILGVVIGGAASWLRHGRWRRLARRLDRDAADLRARLRIHETGSGRPSSLTEAELRDVTPPPRLTLKPPTV
jgi:uncharacterized integral membrane protein